MHCLRWSSSVVGSIAGVDGVVGRRIDVRVGGIFDVRFVADSIVFSFWLARGQAERQDRNGHCNLLHDRSTP